MSHGEAGAAQPLFEITVYCSGAQPEVVARLEAADAEELVRRLQRLAPDEIAVPVPGRPPDAAALLLGLQAFYRLALERGGAVALADTEGALWTVPTREVRAVRIRIVRAGARGRSPAGPSPEGLRRAFAGAETSAGREGRA